MSEISWSFHLPPRGSRSILPRPECGVLTMRCDHACWWCYQGAKGKRARRGHYDPCRLVPVRKRRKRVGRFSTRHGGGPGDLAGGGYPGMGDDASIFPNLVEFLTLDKFDGGVARQPGTLLVFAEGGRLKVCLSDKAEGLVGFVTVDSLDVLLGAVEATLAKDGVDWRQARSDRRR